jgi:hypothetical protein
MGGWKWELVLGRYFPVHFVKGRLFVQEHPIHSQMADGLSELLEVYRFADVAVRAKFVYFIAVLFLSGTGENYNR